MRLATMTPEEVATTDFAIRESDLEQYVGKRIFLSDRLYDETPPGVVMGLPTTVLTSIISLILLMVLVIISDRGCSILYTAFFRSFRIFRNRMPARSANASDRPMVIVVTRCASTCVLLIV